MEVLRIATHLRVDGSENGPGTLGRRGRRTRAGPRPPPSRRHAWPDLAASSASTARLRPPPRHATVNCLNGSFPCREVATLEKGTWSAQVRRPRSSHVKQFRALRITTIPRCP